MSAARLAPDAMVTCPYCDGSGNGPSADGICNGCAGSGESTPARVADDEKHRRHILRKYGRCSLPTPRLPLRAIGGAL